MKLSVTRHLPPRPILLLLGVAAATGCASEVVVDGENTAVVTAIDDASYKERSSCYRGADVTSCEACLCEDDPAGCAAFDAIVAGYLYCGPHCGAECAASCRDSGPTTETCQECVETSSADPYVNSVFLHFCSDDKDCRRYYQALQSCHIAA